MVVRPREREQAAQTPRSRRDEPTNNDLLHRCDHAIDTPTPMNRFTFQSTWTQEDQHIAGLAADR
ncbi:MAG: hypothetical protein CMO61_09630 [Verrucomicrobiales bacterium]|nr:hypothetical protein [Verrucomicrobiales bacterium]